jgi:hypothetical protein
MSTDQALLLTPMCISLLHSEYTIEGTRRKKSHFGSNATSVANRSRLRRKIKGYYTQDVGSLTRLLGDGLDERTGCCLQAQGEEVCRNGL